MRMLMHLYDSFACNVEVNNTFSVKKALITALPNAVPRLPSYPPRLRTSTLQCPEKRLSSPPSIPPPPPSPRESHCVGADVGGIFDPGWYPQVRVGGRLCSLSNSDVLSFVGVFYLRTFKFWQAIIIYF